jgi:hypothetical protein
LIVENYQVLRQTLQLSSSGEVLMSGRFSKPYIEQAVSNELDLLMLIDVA